MCIIIHIVRHVNSFVGLSVSWQDRITKGSQSGPALDRDVPLEPEAVLVPASGRATVKSQIGDLAGKLVEVADLALIVPSDSTPRIQEAHITIGHIICELVERELSGTGQL